MIMPVSSYAVSISHTSPIDMSQCHQYQVVVLIVFIDIFDQNIFRQGYNRQPSFRALLLYILMNVPMHTPLAAPQANSIYIQMQDFNVQMCIPCIYIPT